MKLTKKLLFKWKHCLIILLLSATGCSKNWDKLAISIERGMSSAQVETLLGKPDIIIAQANVLQAYCYGNCKDSYYVIGYDGMKMKFNGKDVNKVTPSLVVNIVDGKVASIERSPEIRFVDGKDDTMPYLKYVK